MKTWKFFIPVLGIAFFVVRYAFRRVWAIVSKRVYGELLPAKGAASHAARV